MKKILLGLMLAGIMSQANAQATFTAKDAAGATQTFKSFNCTPICALNVPADSTGAAFGVTGNPFFITNNGTFATQAAQSGTWNITNVSGTVSLPTGASTSAKQPALGTAGSASTDILTVQGIASMTPFLVTATLNAETTKVIGTVRTLGNAGAIFDAATAAAVPANAIYIGMSQGGNLTGITGTSGNLNVQCANCSGSGVSTADEATFTAGASLFAGTGGFFQTTATNNALTTGQQGMWQMTANRAGFVNLRDTAGAALGVAALPLQVSLANTAANATAVKVDGSAVTQPVSLTSTTITGTVAATQSGTWSDRIVGNAGGVMDAIGQNVAAPANWLQAGCQFQTTPTTITATNGSPCQMDNAGNILVNVKSATGLAQGSTTSGQSGSLVMGAVTTAAPSYTTAQTSPISLDTAGNIRVNCISGCAAGTVSNASSAVATSSTNSGAVSYLYGFNGTTWDQLQVDASKFLKVNISAGTVAATQSGSWSLAANQSVNTAQVNGVTTLTGTGAVGTGAQRIAVGTDTATIAGSAPGTAGSASANVVTVQGVASMTKLLVTPDSVALPANQSVNVAQFGGVSTSTGQVAVSVAPVTATNTALVTALRPDSPGIIALGQTTKSASVPMTIASDQLGASTAANSLPITVGPALLGSYCMGANTGTMAAGLAAAAPIYSFRYGGANLAIVRKIIAEADNITTAFVAGAGKLDLIAARSFSASDTGGTASTLTGNNGKLRTSFATTAISDLRISSTATLTAGTRTLDAQPLASVEFAVPTSIDADLLPSTELFKSSIGESPFVLANNEGFVIQATVPGTGTWVASVRVCWDEVTAF